MTQDASDEARRLLTICNACRYCEGLCAVFPAMTLRREFAKGDLDYLANLCHDCGACYDDCQFAPPHEFGVDLPATLARVRAQSYGDFAWPRRLGSLFQRNGLVIGSACALSVAGLLFGLAALGDGAQLLRAHTGPGAFYRLMPHGVMLAVFGPAFAFAALAMFMSARHFPRATSGARQPSGTSAARSALADAGRLEYLGGGNGGCEDADRERPDRRKLYHHLSFYGFVLCFAATCVATLYHYALGLEAPYAWYEPPVLLGTAGGIGLVIGPIGLAGERLRRAESRTVREWRGMDIAFLGLLFLTSLSGLLLLALRATPAMGVLLALHLGVVFALFITAPYGKFVHGLYRFLALLRYARERPLEAERP